MENEKKPITNSWVFDNPKNIKRVLYFLYACCIILFLLDFVIHRHIVHSWENLWGFYPVYGFVGCVILVVIAKWMRTFLMRSEDYYDNPDPNADPNKDPNQIPNKKETQSKALGGNDVDA